MTDPDMPPPGSRYRPLVGLALLVVVILGVLFIVHRLQDAARIQDCVAAGRTNCAPIEAPLRQ